LAAQKDIVTFKASDTLKGDLDRACSGRCSRSKYVKDEVLKQLALDGKLSLEAAKMTNGQGPCKTLNYVALPDEDKASGILLMYDETASFVTHVLVPFRENGKLFYRDQNGYKWGDDDPDAMPSPIWDDDGECKDIRITS